MSSSRFWVHWQKKKLQISWFFSGEKTWQVMSTTVTQISRLKSLTELQKNIDNSWDQLLLYFANVFLSWIWNQNQNRIWSQSFQQNCRTVSLIQIVSKLKREELYNVASNLANYFLKCNVLRLGIIIILHCLIF